MATLIANQPLDMTSSSGLGIFDTDGGLEPLVSASYADGQQVFSVPGGYMDVTSSVTTSESLMGATFSGGISRLELQTGPGIDDPALWTLTGVPLSFSGSFSFSDDISMSINIAGMGGIQSTMDFDSLEVANVTESFTGATYGSFVEYLMRQGDQITGSSGADRLSGFGGNDTINGKGGKDIVNGGTGNDTMVWGNGDTFFGGGGTDTIRIGAGDVDLTAVAQNKIVNTEQFDLRIGAHTLTLNRGDVLDMSRTDSVRILGDASDTVDIAGGFAEVGTLDGYTTYKLGDGAKLVIDQDIVVI
jgi:Ca2+-binding RTX toxin-like protein